MIQLYMYMYLFFSKFFSHLGCYIILNEFPVLYSRYLLVIHFTLFYFCYSGSSFRCTGFSGCVI